MRGSSGGDPPSTRGHDSPRGQNLLKPQSTHQCVDPSTPQSVVCLAYWTGECAEVCTDGAPRAWEDKDATNGTRPASVLLLSLGGRFLSLYCWACAVCFSHRAGPSS